MSNLSRHSRLANRKRRARESEAAAVLIQLNKQARIEDDESENSAEARIEVDEIENSAELHISQLQEDVKSLEDEK